MRVHYLALGDINLPFHSEVQHLHVVVELFRIVACCGSAKTR